MDKLKYVKLENPDGTYSDSIPLAVDSDHVDVNGDTLTNELNKKASAALVNTNTTNLQNQINGLASGSPLVADSISGMVNTSKIYVNTTDGKWYYYNDNSWNVGGVYQSSAINKLDPAIVDINNSLNILNNTTFNFIEKDIDTSTSHRGYRVHFHTGGDSSLFKVNVINLSKDDKILKFTVPFSNLTTEYGFAFVTKGWSFINGEVIENKGKRGIEEVIRNVPNNADMLVVTFWEEDTYGSFYCNSLIDKIQPAINEIQLLADDINILKQRDVKEIKVANYLESLNRTINSNLNTTYSLSETITDVDNTTFDWVGSVLSLDEKVYSIPNHGKKVLEYDPQTGMFSDFSSIELPDGNFKWTNGCIASDGCIYGFTRTNNNLLKINPRTKETQLIDIGLSYTSEHHYGGVLVDNKIYQPPRNNNDLLIINIETLSVETVTLPINRYCGIISHPNGFIYIIPEVNGKIIKFNPSLKTFSQIGENIQYSCYGMVVAGDGNIYGFRGYKPGILKIDTSNDDVSLLHSEIGQGWYGTLLGLNGKIYSIPGDSTSVYEYDIQNDTISLITSITQSDNEAKCAGGVTLSDGTMVMMPAKGDCIYIFKPSGNSKRGFNKAITFSGLFNNY